ncbi:MAG: hypothetical protein HQK79_18465 [Desulfobacterales bacterium]|nr:hypothetical protein [Desulfobacterales bacterium]
MQVAELINNQEFNAYIKHVVLETIKQMIIETPPKDEVAQLLLLHIKDFQSFKLKVEQEFEKVNKEIASLKQDVAVIKDTMMTKQFWEEEKSRLLKGIGEVVGTILDEKLKK